MKKDAGVAALLNAIMPGFGWLYCEKLSYGIISLIIDSALWIWILSVRYESDLLAPILISALYWIISIVGVFNDVKDTNFEEHQYKTKKLKKPITVACDRCGHKFNIISLDAVKCPKCGHINGPFALKGK